MKIHRKSNETQVIGRCERVMIRHDIVGVRKEKVILIVTGPFPFVSCHYTLHPRNYFPNLASREALLDRFGIGRQASPEDNHRTAMEI